MQSFKKAFITRKDIKLRTKRQLSSDTRPPDVDDGDAGGADLTREGRLGSDRHDQLALPDVHLYLRAWTGGRLGLGLRVCEK